MSLHNEIMNIYCHDSLSNGVEYKRGHRDARHAAAKLAMQANADTESFTYVDITTSGCDGWLNLFFGDHVIALINNKSLADEMRKTINKKPTTQEA